MRIRWRGLELPARVARDEAVSTDVYGRFVIDPFEQGFGTTIGNSLRRVLLSSLEGSAVTSIKIAGVSHEFTSIEGVFEDVTDIVLNVKALAIRLEGDEEKTLTVRRDTAGPVRASDIVCDSSVIIVNPDHTLATLTADVPFEMEMAVGNGRGYRPAPENRASDQELGVIPVDSVFSPVIRVRYRTEDMRVGQRTNYDRLIMEIWTDGSVRPEDALVEASLILRKHLNPLIMQNDLGDDTVEETMTVVEPAPTEDNMRSELLDKPVAVLNLSVRASNCLEAAGIATVGQLVDKTEAELLRYRSFGKTSLNEVQAKLRDVGLSLSSDGGQAGVGLPDAAPIGDRPAIPGVGVLPLPPVPQPPASTMEPPTPLTGAEDVPPGEAGDAGEAGEAGDTGESSKLDEGSSDDERPGNNVEFSSLNDTP